MSGWTCKRQAALEALQEEVAEKNEIFTGRDYKRAFQWQLRRFAPILARQRKYIRRLVSGNKIVWGLVFRAEGMTKKIAIRRDRWRRRCEAAEKLIERMVGDNVRTQPEMARLRARIADLEGK